MSDKDWYYVLINDWNKLPDFLDYFSKEAENAKLELKIKGGLLSQNQALPSLSEFRFGQLQILNASLEYFEIQRRKERSVLYKKYLEHYQKTLSSRDCDKYIDGEESIVNYDMIINEIALVRNIFMGIMKGLESKAFSLNNITKLQAAGLVDAEVE